MDDSALVHATSRQIEAEIQRLGVEQDKIKERRHGLKMLLRIKLVEEEKLKARGINPFERA